MLLSENPLGCHFPPSKMCIIIVSAHDQRESGAVTLIESKGNKGSLQVNGAHVKKGTSCVLNSGDEVVFGSLGNHAYVSFMGYFVLSCFEL